MSTASAGHLCQSSVDFLLDVWSPELGLFPYSTSISAGEYVNDFRRPAADRYTINTLLGLEEAAGAGLLDTSEFSRLVEQFLELRFADLTSIADVGLLLVLLKEHGTDVSRREALGRLVRLATDGAIATHDIQTLSWALWGLCAAAPSSADAERAAHDVFKTISTKFVDDVSQLARHSVRLYRRGLVSFGSTVYFLRAMHEYAALTADKRAEELFENGVRTMVRNQGPRGEWPWLFSVRRGFRSSTTPCTPSIKTPWRCSSSCPLSTAVWTG